MRKALLFASDLLHFLPCAQIPRFPCFDRSPYAPFSFWPGQLLENVYIQPMYIIEKLCIESENAQGNLAVSRALIPRSKYDRTSHRKSSPQNVSISILVLPTNTSPNYVGLFAELIPSLT